MIFKVVIVFIQLASVLSAAFNSDCVTPQKENAKCVPVTQCNLIYSRVQSQDAEAIEYARQSYCGHHNQVPHVCCGTKPLPTKPPTDIFNLFTTAATVQTSKPTEKPKEEVKPTSPSPPLEDYESKVLPDRTICGQDTEGDRIWGGEVTKLREFPWMVALEFEKNGVNAGVRCGGSLISKRHVITAAHCILNREFKLTNVRLGEWDVTKDPDCDDLPSQSECADEVLKVEVEEKIPHPYYTTSGNNDIAILVLAKEIAYTEYIQPICLPPRNIPPAPNNTPMTVAGWGVTENGTTSDIKLKVAVPLLPITRCLEKLKRKSLGVNQVCAGGEKGRDSCTGDSGGPLMRPFEDPISKQTNWYQEGVVSIGVGCARSEYPAIYTRLDRYINWIINQIDYD